MMRVEETESVVAICHSGPQVLFPLFIDPVLFDMTISASVFLASRFADQSLKNM